MARIDQKLKVWRNKLFDKSRNNEMLNVRTTRKKYVSIKTPGYVEIYDKIVMNDRQLSFKQPIDQNTNFVVGSTMALMTKLGFPMAAYKGDILGVSVGDINDTLYALRKDTEHYKNEFGVDILHLSFGYITWKLSPEDNDMSNTPLINVPVHLERKKINTPYLISKIGDAVLNPALIYLLEDYGISLPEFDQNMKIDKYFDQIEKIASLNGWKFNRDVGLNLLKYQKISMFIDLNNPENIQRIKNNKLLTSISGDRPYDKLTIEEVNNISNNQDGISETNQILVLDADSSQLDAITLAEKGESFVLYGPPGTGKSQTITNLIATSLYHGKKVLFVAQKLAALEVVYNKLKQVRLDDFCLLLHDVKAKKKEVIDKIYKPLEGIQRTKVTDSAIKKLQELEDTKVLINSYFKNVHEKIMPIGQTLFEMLNHYYDLLNEEDLKYPLMEVLNVTYEELENIARTIQKFEIEYNLLNEVDCEYWLKTNLLELSLDNKRKLEQELSDLIILTEEVYNSLVEINKLIPCISLDHNEYLKHVKPINELLNTPICYPKLFNRETIEENYEIVSNIEGLIEKSKTLENKLNNFFTSKIYELDLIKLVNAFTNLIENIRVNVPSFRKYNDDLILSVVSRYYQGVIKYQNNLELLDLTKEKLDTYLDINENDYLNNDFNVIKEKIVNRKFDQNVHKIVKTNKYEMFSQDINEIINYLDERKVKYNKVKNYFEENTDSVIYISHDVIKHYHEEMSEFNSLDRLFNKEFKALVIEINQLFNTNFKSRTLLDSLESLYEYQIIDNKVVNKIKDLNMRYYYLEFDLNTDYLALKECADNSYELLKVLNLENDDIFIKKLCYGDVFVVVSLLDEYESALKKIKISEEETEISYNTPSLKEVIEIIIDSIEKLDSEFNKNISIFKNFDSKYQIGMYFKSLNEYQNIKMEINSIRNKINDYVEYSNDYNSILNVIEKIRSFYQIIDLNNYNEKDILSVLFDEEKRLNVLNYNYVLNENISPVEEKIKKFNQYFDGVDYTKYSFDKLIIEFKNLLDTIEGLNTLVNYRKYRRSITNPHIVNFITRVENTKITKRLDRVFLKNFYSELIENYIYSVPYLNSITRTKIVGQIEKLSKGFNNQYTISESRIRSKIMENIPTLDGIMSEKDSRAILRKEHTKKSRIMPLRKLFNTIPDLMLQLQPCIMMSPIAVSSFLENDKYDFDVVIFDEASQIFPEDAIGAIYRGKQIIIAGDSNQLPPTSFFTKLNNDDLDEYVEDDYEDVGESILDLATISLNNCSLKWHYRSKDERLIAFSNKYIYDNNLITFPSNYMNLPDSGVEFVYVENGIYDQKGNFEEANKVVELIKEHIDKYPNKSLGVIAFSKRQQTCLELAIENFRRNNIKYEFFFASDKVEPFFVKNIENVQGDERDVIIFSISYSKGPDGVLRHNFGPLQIAGGERRLNVAVSRSKYNLKVVSSIKSIDIDSKKINSKGANLLKEYLAFAENNNSLVEEEQISQEEAISKQSLQTNISEFLNDQGLKTITNYGYSNFKIDIVVLDPNDENKFICGILLDGSYYEADHTCRGREYLKQVILEKNGWKVYRIWSYLWYKNTKDEQRKIINFISGKEPVKKEPKKEELVTESTIDIKNNKTNTRDYTPYKFNDKLFPSTSLITSSLLKAFVKAEQPTHRDHIVDSIIKVYSLNRWDVDHRVKAYLRAEMFKHDGDYYYLDPEIIKIPRRIKNQDKLKVDYLYPKEIAIMMMYIVRNSYGLDRESLIRSTMEVFGYKVMTAKIKTRFNEVINILISINKMREVDGMVSAVNENGK